MEELCNMGFLNEVKEKKGGYYQYRYTLTENGEDFLDEMKWTCQFAGMSNRYERSKC